MKRMIASIDHDAMFQECNETADKLDKIIHTYIKNLVKAGILVNNDDIDILTQSVHTLEDVAAYAQYQLANNNTDDESIDDYFEYLYDVHDGDIEEACMEIDYSFGNEDLPDWASGMSYRDLQNKFIAWAKHRDLQNKFID